jgi:hypothetical protein
LLATGVIGGHEPTAYAARAVTGPKPALFRAALVGFAIAVAIAIAIAIAIAGVAVSVSISVPGFPVAIPVAISVAVAVAVPIPIPRVSVAISVARIRLRGRRLRVPVASVITADREQRAHDQHLEQFMCIHVSPRAQYFARRRLRESVFSIDHCMAC